MQGVGRRRGTPGRPGGGTSWGGVDGVQVAGEAAYLAQPEAGGDRLDPCRQASPGHRQLDGDGPGPAGGGAGDEPGQHAAVLAELEAQPATQAQVVIELPGQGAHDAAPAGQGRAMVRSRSTSTRA